MKIKTSIRAGSGGASGVGGNSTAQHSGVDSTAQVIVVPPPVYTPVVSRCAGF